MALDADSYGDPNKVAALVPRYANQGGAFDTTTRPTLAHVEHEMNLVSALVNAMLATHGFTTPVTQSVVLKTLAYFVEQETAAIVEGINGSGRFGPTTKSSGGRGRFALVMDDVEAFIEKNAIGFQRLGAERPYTATAGMAYRGSDERGNAVDPIFQRAAFGNRFDTWD